MKTSSRPQGRVAAVGSVKRPSPGRTGMSETRRFRPFMGPRWSGEVRPFPDVRAAQEIETRGVASSACSDLLRAAEQTLRQIDLYPGHLQNREETARYRKRRHTLAGRWRVEKFDDDGGLRQPPRANSSFSKDHSQRFEPRQQWLPVGGDCVAQQPNQRPAIVLGQVERAFCRQRITTRHRGPLSG